MTDQSPETFAGMRTSRSHAARLTAHHIAAATLLVISVSLLAGCAPDAYGHGLGYDTIQSVFIGGETFVISVQVVPPESESDDGQITLAVRDQAGETVENLTLAVRLFHKGEILLDEQLFAEDGTVWINTGISDDVRVSGERRQGVLVTAADGQPTLTGPTLGSGGLYQFEIEVVTVHDASDIMEGGDIYSADVSIMEGDIHEQTDMVGNKVLFQTKSYFDSVTALEYEPESGVITVAMPFDWRERVISHVPVVHVEVHIPKEFDEFIHPGYTGKVNGVDLFHSSVIIDDYTSDDDRIVHFVILSDQLKSLKIQQNQAAGDIPDMVFALEAADDIRFPVIAYTLDERFRVDVSWDPVEILPGEPTNFVFTIRDGVTNEPLRQSSYSFVLIQDNHKIYSTSGNAVIGGSFETFTFSEEHAGPITIRFDDIRGTNAATEITVMVVPEFGVAMISLVLGGAAVVALSRFRYGLRIAS